MRTGTVAPRRRRTQEERSAETRLKLLEATLEILAESGYQSVTMRGVAERAGVSPGAATHHFPQRVELVAAAIDQLAARSAEGLSRIIDALPDDRPARVAEFLDAWWQYHSSPVFTIFVKLWVAAAEEPQLYRRLIPLEERVTHQIAELGRRLDPSLANDRDFLPRVHLAMSAMRGFVIAADLEPRRRPMRDPWPIGRKLLMEILSPRD